MTTCKTLDITIRHMTVVLHSEVLGFGHNGAVGVKGRLQLT